VKKWGANVALLACSVLFALILCEVGVRVLYPRFANYNMEMWRYFAEMKMPLARPNLPFVHFPNRSGHYYGVEIVTNSMGFRDAECPPQKTPGTSRILFVGDSQTLGWGTREEDTMAARLERKFNEAGRPCEIVNMGIGNYNSMMELELFKWKGLPLQPDLVVLVYFINDAEPTPHLSRAGYQLKSRSYLFAYLYDRYVTMRPSWNPTYTWRTFYQDLYRPEAPALAANRKALEEFARLCRENGIKLLVVNYPELHELRDYPFPAATDYIRSFAEKEALPFFDLHPAFAPHDPATLWVSTEDTHGNAKTNELAAEALYEPISELLKR